MDIVHAIHHHGTHLLESFEWTHARDGITLHEYVAISEQFKRFKGGTIRAKQSLPSLNEALLVAYDASYLYNVRLHVILHDLYRLLDRDANANECLCFKSVFGVCVFFFFQLLSYARKCYE